MNKSFRNNFLYKGGKNTKQMEGYFQFLNYKFVGMWTMVTKNKFLILVERFRCLITTSLAN